MPWSYTRNNDTELCITHNGGFFSCCNIKLHEIVFFFNAHKKLPLIVDSSEQFASYKINKSTNDITFHYFEDKKDKTEFSFTQPIEFNQNYQFRNYANIRYSTITPFISKYFSPSAEIKNKILFLIGKYNIDYENTCVLFYRGNDKNRETRICGYDEYVVHAQNILHKYPGIKLWVQSDETEFIEKMLSEFPRDTFIMSDEIRHIKKCDSTVDKMKNDIDKYSQFFFAITLIMSKCKIITCGTGNCSLWLMLYRGGTENVYQNYNGNWLIH